MNRPNLLFVFSDQQSFDMLGCAGNAQIKTPHLDAFAEEGLRFEHAVANSPVCTPSRGMLLTGRHPLHNNCFTNDRRLLNGTEIGPGIGHVLRDAGYRMGYIGKWHLYGGNRDRGVPAGPDRHGFDDVFLTNNCAINYHPDEAFYWSEDGRRVKFNQWEAGGQTDQALAFLEETDPGQPFALYLSWHPPHNHFGGDCQGYSGFDAPPEFKALYNEEEIIPPRDLPNTPENRRMILGYYAMCSEIDHHFGRLMRRLEERGLAEKTLVVFTSDHGETFGANAAHSHKNTPMDVSVRVPLLMRWPGRLPAGQVRQLLFGLLDMPPTLAGLLGQEIPSNWQGRDLSAPILEGNDDAVESVPIFNFQPSWRGVYTRRHTFCIENLERTLNMGARVGSDMSRRHIPNFNVLFDRERDPLQSNSLFNSSEHIDLALALTQLTHDWCAAFRDPFLSYEALSAIVGKRDDTPPIDLIAPVLEEAPIK